MTNEPRYDTLRISAANGVAYFKRDHDKPAPTYRELFPRIAAAYEAAEAENAKGAALNAAYREALAQLRAHQQGLRDDEYADPADEAKLAAAVRKAERAMEKQSSVSRRALTAYDKLVFEEAIKGGIKGVSRERAVDAQARVLTLGAELLAALNERESAWTLAGQPFGRPVEPGTVMKRVVDTGNRLGELELLLQRLSAFPDLTGPAEQEKSPSELRAEVDRQNTDVANAVKARSRREGL